MFRLISGLLVFVLISPGVLFAAGWESEVAVADRSSDEQSMAIEMALRQVILINSGDKTVLNRDSVREAMRDAQRFVLQAGYVTPEPGTVLDQQTLLTPRVTRSGQATQLFRVAFDPAPLLALIQQSPAEDGDEDSAPALRVAGPDTLLLWMQVVDGDTRILVGGEQGVNVMGRARELAGASALTLVFPSAVAGSALEGSSVEAAPPELLRNLSRPWPTPEIATALILRDAEGRWVGRWRRFASDGQAQAPGTRSELVGDSLDEALQAGVNWLMPQGVPSYQAGAGSQVEGLVFFSGMAASGRYAEVNRFLMSVPGVQSAWPREMAGDYAIFAVRPREALGAVQQSLGGQGWAQAYGIPVEAASSSLAADITLAVDTR